MLFLALIAQQIFHSYHSPKLLLPNYLKIKFYRHTTISIYRELKPISSKHDLEAIAVTGLNLEKLEVDDLDLLMAIVNLKKWL